MRFPTQLRARPALLLALALPATGTLVGPLDVEASEAPTTEAVLDRIEGRRIAGRVRFLASRFLEGRAAGTRGERLAAEYIRDFYYGLGLTPAGDDGSFYQDFELDERTLGEGNALQVIHDTADGRALETDYALERGFVPFVFSPSARVEAPVVFAGYGITAPEYDYDDYAGIDARGRIVLVLRHEPGESDPDAEFKGLRSTRHAAFLSKVRRAQQLGAVGVLVVTDPLNHTPDSRDPGNRLARWHSLVERGEFDTRPAPDPYQYYPEMAPDVRIPAMHVSSAAAEDLLAGSGATLEERQRRIDDRLRPESRELTGVRARIVTDVVVRPVEVRNVLAKIEGSDPELRGEAIVIGGHYDHVGYGHFGSRSGAWGQIHPGADDNASGTASILTIAEAFATAGVRPRRTLLFAHFTAEEKGLLGSRWYVDHPTVPLADTVAMLNLDMVGRNEPRVVSIVGDADAAGLDRLIKRLGTEQLHLEIDNDAGSGVDRSDQWAFALHDVPAIAFFSGVHEDYHRPSDTASRIVPDKMQNIARLVALTAWRLAEDGRSSIEVEAR